MIFIVHICYEGKPNIQFRIHESVLNYFGPRDQKFTFFNTISENKEGFTSRKSKSAEFPRCIYVKLVYPSAN